MTLKVFLAASLRKYVPGYNGDTGYDMEVSPGETAGDVAEKLGIPRDEVKLIIMNGIGSKWDTAIDGEGRLAFFPPVGGG